MSIENNLNRIADSNDKIVELLSAMSGNNQPVAPAPVAPVAPAPVAPAPVAPVPVASPSNVPFTDNAGLMQYVMTKYKELGPEKGVKIQTVLQSLGYNNVNDIQPEKYESFFNGVESIV